VSKASHVKCMCLRAEGMNIDKVPLLLLESSECDVLMSVVSGCV